MYLFFLQIRKNKQGTGPAPETAHLSPSRIWPPVLQRKKRLDPSRKGFFFIYLFIFYFFITKSNLASSTSTKNAAGLK